MPNPLHEPSGPISMPLGRPPDVLPEQVERLRARLFSKGPRTIRHYELRGVIGRGGFGQVHRAYDTKLRRHVALKELRFSSASDLIRLEREAQALARLSHPNVVQVHDSGVMGESTYYIVMEYVEGSSLAHWQSIETRPQAALLDQYLQVARGLLAAHRAGLVHRDFKPSNAVVGQDGRTRVLDFGLAKQQVAMPAPEDEAASVEISPSRGPSQRESPRSRPSGGASTTDGADEHEDAEPTPASTDGSLTPRRLAVAPDADTELWGSEPGVSEQDASFDAEEGHGAAEVEPPQTTTGHFKGTPRYASPEQLLGERLDARSDQFSFCVSLFEAVYGHHPFADEDNTVPLIRVVSGEVKWHDVGRAPPWLRRLLRRGLSRHAEDRFESLEPIVRELESRLRPRRRWPWVVVGGGIAVGLMIPAVIEQQAEGCGGFEEEIERVWDEPARERLREAIDTGGTGDAAPLLASLDAYATRWQRERQRACQLERTRAEPEAIDPDASELDASVTIACLERQRDELGTIVEELSAIAPEAPGVQIDESSLWQALPPEPRLCRDPVVARGLAVVDQTDAAREVVQVQAQLRRARVERMLGRFEASAALARRALEQAESLGHAPLRAASEYQLGVAQAFVTATEQEALEHLRQASVLAEAEALDILAVEALAQLVAHRALVRARDNQLVTGASERAADEALMLSLAFAKIEALDMQGTELEAWVYMSAGNAQVNSGRWNEAVTSYQRASEIFSEHRGRDDFITAGIDLNVAAAMVRIPEMVEQSVRVADDALERRILVGGERHPLVVDGMVVAAKIHQRARDFDGALTLHRRALELIEEREGPGRGEAPWIRLEIAQSLRHAGDLEGAVQSLDAFERDLADLPEDERHPDRMLRWVAVAKAIAGQRADWGRLGQVVRTELELLERHHPERTRAVAVAALNLHSAQRKLGRRCEAWSTFGRYEDVITRELEDQVAVDLAWFREQSDRCNNTKGSEP